MERFRDKSGDSMPNAARFLDIKSGERWYVVANRSEATILRRGLRRGSELSLLAKLDNPTGRLKESEFISDRTGRSFSNASAGNAGAGTIRHGLDGDNATYKTQDAVRFAAQIIEYLKHAGERPLLTELVLVAGPQFMGHLRSALHGSLKPLVKEEIVKEYAHATEHELKEQILRLEEKNPAPTPSP